jgi:prolyl-tRNA synthetase
MKFKEAFIHTLREEPAEAELISHKLMLRASMIQKLASGIYNYLPLGLRVVRKIEKIIREEMAACGATELLMPAVIPAELWQESGRWNYYGPELLRLKDRKQNEFCIGPTHEEVIVDVARHGIRSYRDLPSCLYQIQDKFRDEVRPRYGLMRAREFIMKDAYSFHADEKSLDEMYWKMHKAYTNIFKRCGLDFRPVEADSGTIGGDVTHEFHVLADSGEDTIAYCDSCKYAANIEKAAARYVESEISVPDNAENPGEVHTPGKKSIEDVCSFLAVEHTQAVKMLVYDVNDGEYLVAVCIRGDREINEAKLRGMLGADSVAIPDDEELSAKTGLAVGFLGPHGIRCDSIKKVVADYSVRGMHDCVCGANKPDYHVMHMYPGRDLQIDEYGDLGFVHEGQHCPRCKNGTLRLRSGIEVGQVFKLGRKYSSSMNLTFLNEKSEQQLATMGCYGIGVGRTAAAAIEQNHDSDGIRWPVAIAPFSVVICALDPGATDVLAASERLHSELEATGIDVLLDDRKERPGVKFKDADLIGFPVRVVVGSKKINDKKVEIKQRASGAMEDVPVESALDRIVNLISLLGNSR